MKSEDTTERTQNLPKSWKEGFEMAKNARSRAYVPYSSYRVGFALHEIEGNVFIPGVNVENASYGGTICAERSALMGAVSSRGLQTYDFGVLVTDGEPPAVPCAICLQVLMELCGPDFILVLCDLTGPRQVLTMSQLLPYYFVQIPETSD